MHRGCRAAQFVDMLRSVAKYAARTERRGKTVHGYFPSLGRASPCQNGNQFVLVGTSR
jgi:hypothetical protein